MANEWPLMLLVFIGFPIAILAISRFLVWVTKKE
jgi:hypothetical protein